MKKKIWKVKWEDKNKKKFNKFFQVLVMAAKKKWKMKKKCTNFETFSWWWWWKKMIVSYVARNIACHWMNDGKWFFFYFFLLTHTVPTRLTSNNFSHNNVYYYYWGFIFISTKKKTEMFSKNPKTQKQMFRFLKMTRKIFFFGSFFNEKSAQLNRAQKYQNDKQKKNEWKYHPTHETLELAEKK